jgi:pSer/pThr/pTyr-binding forkhead associated (FHA) protein
MKWRSKNLTFYPKLSTLSLESFYSFLEGGEMAAQYQLTMQSGPNPGKVFSLEGDDLTLGREAGNQIIINDAEISRRHARLYLQGGKYVIEDLGSTNGTFINGGRITGPHVLRPGEVISFGEQISVVFESVADPNATLMSAAKPVAAPPPRYAPPPAPAPAYASRAPESPAPVQPAANRTPLIIAGVVVLCVICACGGFLYYVDSNALWCTYLPFLFGAACP